MEQEKSFAAMDKEDRLSLFTKIEDKLVASSDDAWKAFYHNWRLHAKPTYTIEEIERIINSQSLSEMQKLSRAIFEQNGLYKKIIYYYATLLTYSCLLIPNPSFGKQLSEPHISKRYHLALSYLNRLNLPEVMTRMSLRALLDGSYYGIIQTLDKNHCILFDLPAQYCRSRYKDVFGNDIVEFDVSYFNTISDSEMQSMALKTYPKIVSDYYRRLKRGKVTSSWIKLPADIGVCFPFFDDGRPMFLDVIPSTLLYDDAVETDRERDLEEIKKILVQKIPHLTDGTLLFDPPEAVSMHQGAVNMMKGNKNLSVLTTYADVDAIVSRTTSDVSNNSIEKMLQNVYSKAGVSAQIFSPTGSQALPFSIKNDISLMMVLGNKYGRFYTHILNTLFANSNIDFSVKILPVSLYNQNDFVDESLKLAKLGYSYILPSTAMGVNQLELINLKSLENDVLHLEDVLITLSSKTESTGDVGAPEKRLEDKAPKTIQNEDAIDHQGGSE